MADSTTLKAMFIGGSPPGLPGGNPRPAKGLTEKDFADLVQELEYALMEATRNGERRVRNAIRGRLPSRKGGGTVSIGRRQFMGTLGAGFVALLGRLRPERADPGRALVWTTAVGRQVAIGDMSDDHLRNTIHFLNRWHGVKTGRFYRTDASETFPELYDAMRREATRRRLSWL
jgi:hypothetical protein